VVGTPFLPPFHLSFWQVLHRFFVFFLLSGDFLALSCSQVFIVRLSLVCTFDHDFFFHTSCGMRIFLLWSCTSAFRAFVDVFPFSICLICPAFLCLPASCVAFLSCSLSSRFWKQASLMPLGGRFAKIPHSVRAFFFWCSLQGDCFSSMLLRFFPVPPCFPDASHCPCELAGFVEPRRIWWRPAFFPVLLPSVAFRACSLDFLELDFVLRGVCVFFMSKR